MIGVFLIVTVLTVLYFYTKWGSRKGVLLPGPKGLPFIGIGFALTPENMYFMYSQYCKKYGDIFRHTMFGHNVIVLNSADLIRKAYNNEPYKRFMNDRVKSFYGDHFLYGCKGLISMDTVGATHSALRKAFAQAMRVYGVGRKEFEDLVLLELSHLTKKIELCSGQPFDFQDLIQRSLRNIITIMLVGHRVKTDEEFKMLHHLDRASDFFFNAKINLMMKLFPFLRKIPSSFKDRYEELEQAKRFIIEEYYNNMKATYKTGVIRGFVDFMIEERLQSHRNGASVLYTDEMAIATIIDTFNAGVVTTLTHLSSMFVLLMNHPEYQRQIQEEVDRATGKDRLPTLADRQHCPLLEAVTLETHRLLPVVPGLLPHACSTNIEFEGYDIPQNSLIIPNVFHVHHDEKIWGDPWNFRPERFLDERGNILPNDHLFKQSWLAFGTGRRQCVGESLARSRAYLFAAFLLQRWTFELPAGSQISFDPRSEDFDWHTVLRPKPFQCKAVPRESMKGKLF